MTVREEEISWR